MPRAWIPRGRGRGEVAMPLDAVAWYDAPERDLRQARNDHKARLREIEARISAELAAQGAAGPARGIARPVFRDDGEYYPSVSDAARKNDGARADYICQAIRWHRKCRGFRWAYVDDIPADFWVAFIEANDGLASAWPWRPGVFPCRIGDVKFNEVTYAAAG